MYKLAPYLSTGLGFFQAIPYKSQELKPLQYKDIQPVGQPNVSIVIQVTQRDIF
jgi:hypothetical protein